MNFYMDLFINIIIQSYFGQDRCVMILVDGNNSVEFMTGKTPVVHVKLDENFNFDKIFHYFGCTGILVKSDRPAVFFENFEKEIRLRIERFQHRKYLFAPGSNMDEAIDDIFNTTAINYITDMIVLQETNSSVLVWTNKYVGTEDNNQKVLLDEWYFENQTFLLNNDLYPDKLLNQMGRVLRLGTVYYKPYSIFKDTDDMYDNKGSELKPVLVYSEKHNVTPILVIGDDDAFWGDLYDNWTGTGLLGNLLYDKVDVAFGALYMLDSFYPYVDWSKPTLKSGVTVLVPTPKILAGWLTPIHAYNPTMWLVLLVMFVVSVFLLHLLHRRNSTNTNRSLDNSALTMIKMFLLQGVSRAEIPHGLKGKYFMLMMFVFEVFLSSSYGSGFASIMTVPRYEKPVDTVRDLAESEVGWGANTNEWIVAIRQFKEPEYVKIVQNFHDFDDETLMEKSYEGNFGFSIERLPNNEFAVSPYVARDVISKFRVMQDDLDWQQCVVMFRKNSVLLPSFDKLLMRIIECGLISHWQSEGVYLYMDSQVQIGVKYSNSQKSKESNLVKLKLTHVVGAFAMLCLGCVLSTVVFILEVIYGKRPRVPMRTNSQMNLG